MSFPGNRARVLPRTPSDFRRTLSLGVSCGVVLLGFLLYRGVLEAGFTQWDDDVYVTRNTDIHELTPSSVARIFTTFSNCNYHPLTYLTWMGEFRLVGLSPWLYHLNNLLLHVGTAVLSFFLARRLLENDAAAALTAALFVVHPLRVESVAWVAERKDVLCAFFYVAGLLAYVRWIDGASRVHWVAAFALALAASLSKVMAVTFPAAQALVLVYRRQWNRRQLAFLAPFAALGLVFAVLGYAAQRSCGGVRGLQGGELLTHVLTVPKALSIYAWKLVVPHPLSPRYMYGPAEGLADPRALAGIALAAAGAAVLLLSLRCRRVAFLGLGFFAVTWAPVSGIVSTGTVVADRYMYIPALGLLWPVALGVVEGLCGPPRRRSLAAGGLVVLLVLAAVWGALTVKRVEVWRNGVTLWRDALEENPANPYAHNQLAVEYLARGEYEKAAPAALRSIELGLREPRFLFNVCIAYRALGELDKERETARGILAGAPDFLPARTVELRHMREAGRLDECERRIAGLIERFGDHPGLLAARGDLHRARGDDAAALEDYVSATRKRPNDREVLLKLSVVAARLGDADGAARAAELALRLGGSVLRPWELQLLAELEALLAPGGTGEAVPGSRVPSSEK